jgi:hypothetical protein
LTEGATEEADEEERGEEREGGELLAAAALPRP